MKTRPIRPDLLSSIEPNAKLLAHRCSECEQIFFPKNGSYCLNCLADKALDGIELSGKGNLYSFTQSEVSSEFFEPPYVCGYVQLEEGPLVFAPLKPDCQVADLSVGMPVEIIVGEVWQSEDESVIGYHFRPS